jgi:hypothetical protein
VRDVVVPDCQRYIHSLAFYSFFRSGRRALTSARDDLDRQFLKFLSESYCVR